MKILALLLALDSTALASPSGTVCEKVIVTANMTDMREELEKYKKQGWRTKGKLIFKDYAFHQVVVCKKKKN